MYLLFIRSLLHAEIPLLEDAMYHTCPGADSPIELAHNLSSVAITNFVGRAECMQINVADHISEVGRVG